MVLDRQLREFRRKSFIQDSEHARNSSTDIVHHLHLCPVHPAHRASRDAAEHELRRGLRWRDSAPSRNDVALLGSLPVYRPCEDELRFGG